MGGTNDTAKILFTLADEQRGDALSPGNISLDEFNRFNQEVAAFLKGSLPKDEAQALLRAARPRVRAGSYGLELSLPAQTLDASLQADLELLEGPGRLAGMDPKRAAVVQKWQRDASQRPQRRYVIRSELPGRRGGEARIDAATKYCAADTEAWIPVEKYLSGEVVRIGGAKPNLHLKCKPDRPPVVIAADTATLHEDGRNRIYRRVMVRVAAEQSYPGGALRKLRLLEFCDPPAMPSKEEFDADVKEATALWADVDNASEWVERLRGHIE